MAKIGVARGLLSANGHKKPRHAWVERYGAEPCLSSRVRPCNSKAHDFFWDEASRSVLAQVRRARVERFRSGDPNANAGGHLLSMLSQNPWSRATGDWLLEPERAPHDPVVLRMRHLYLAGHDKAPARHFGLQLGQRASDLAVRTDDQPTCIRRGCISSFTWKIFLSSRMQSCL